MSRKACRFLAGAVSGISSGSPSPTVVGLVADGMDEAETLATYPDLEAEDLREVIRYAAEAVRERELPLTLWLRSAPGA